MKTTLDSLRKNASLSTVQAAATKHADWCFKEYRRMQAYHDSLPFGAQDKTGRRWQLEAAWDRYNDARIMARHLERLSLGGKD